MVAEDGSEEDGQPEGGDTQEGYAVEKQIQDVSGAEPWISVIGTVISRNTNESLMLLDDGTGQIDVRVMRLPELGSLVRILGKPFKQAGKLILDGIVVQDFSGFDVELYRRIRDLEERVFSQEGDYHR